MIWMIGENDELNIRYKMIYYKLYFHFINNNKYFEEKFLEN